MKKIRCRLIAGICMLLFAVFMLPLPAAAGRGTGTLALWCVRDDEIISGMHWQIYRVGHREENDYVFEGDFSGYRPTLGDQTRPMLEWSADTVAGAAETLRTYVLLDDIPVRGEGLTDDKGNLNFSGLEDGLYLVIGDTLKKGTKTYVPGAVFFEMNGQEEAYLNSYPKIIFETLDKQTEEYSVRKVWMNDKDQPRDENACILCELYRDGELTETVRLDAGNDWMYQWSDQAGHEWLVREKEIPRFYTVVYKRNHTQYLIVNTYDRPHNDSSITDENTTPASTTTTGSAASDRQTTAVTGRYTTQPGDRGTTVGYSSGRPSAPTDPPRTYTTAAVTSPPAEPPADVPKLPQTGMLWWPVPLLAGAGLTLISVGVWIGKKDEEP